MKSFGRRSFLTAMRPLLALRSAALATLLLATAAPDSARADPPAAPDAAALRWNPEWPRFGAAEYAVTAATGIAAIAEYVWVPPQRQPHWVGGELFDDDTRNALRLSRVSARRTAWLLADAVGVVEPVVVVGIDSMLTPVLRGSAGVAWQLTWIDFESYALGSIAAISLYDTVGRARPSYLDCQRDPSVGDCAVSPTASFPSGHAAEAFISAGLSCANHEFVHIYGSRAMDWLACARDLTLATADGVLRIMGDRHWATDVLAGSAIGFAFGYGLPVLLHYASPWKSRTTGIALAPMGGGAAGVTAIGAF